LPVFSTPLWVICRRFAMREQCPLSLSEVDIPSLQLSRV
jgi:hypothetical protein